MTEKPQSNREKPEAKMKTNYFEAWYRMLVLLVVAAVASAPMVVAAQVIPSLLGGHVNSVMQLPGALATHVRSGSLRVLAALSSRRDPAFADVPTLSESGYPGFEVASFFGVLAPAGTPPEIVARLAGDLAAVMDLPDVREFRA